MTAVDSGRDPAQADPHRAPEGAGSAGPSVAAARPSVGAVEPSPAGPVAPQDGALLMAPDVITSGERAFRWRYVTSFWDTMMDVRARYGDVVRVPGSFMQNGVITSHPDHVKSLFSARSSQATTMASESPIRPVMGPNSVVTANPPSHTRQRKLLMPMFHGDAIKNYHDAILDITERTISSLPVGRPIALSRPIADITLDVIMAGIFGVREIRHASEVEREVKRALQRLMTVSASPLVRLSELRVNISDVPTGPLKWLVAPVDQAVYNIIAARRADARLEDKVDILSVLLKTETEDGQTLSDHEIRDELISLLVAGHDTTATTLTWAWERLLRTPQAHEQLIDAARSAGTAEPAKDAIENTLNETMRVRPVIPIIGRRVAVPWQLGDVIVEAGTPIMMSTLLLHHRDDLYPDPMTFAPERWDGHTPSSSTWLPFGGGSRRCLGATMAMAEMRTVLERTAARLDMHVEEEPPERPIIRNVTMLPNRGGRVVIDNIR